MRYLNQLVCIALFLSCLHAFRSYLNAAAPAPVPVPKLKITNGTDWQVTVRYTTPAGVVTSDTIAPNGAPIIITIKPDEDASYSLEKEQGKVKTATRKVPAAAISQGTFEITPENIKELVAASLPPIVVSPATVRAAAPAPTATPPATVAKP